MRGRAVTVATIAALAAGGGVAAGAGGASVSITDNAFVRRHQRPVVAVRAGSVVTWRWHSQQSHGVMVRSGPERFASTIRNRGHFSHRFRRPGTYRLVCPIHAPGMKMTVIVRR